LPRQHAVWGDAFIEYVMGLLLAECDKENKITIAVRNLNNAL
jgi:hypothetical protein